MAVLWHFEYDEKEHNTLHMINTLSVYPMYICSIFVLLSYENAFGKMREKYIFFICYIFFIIIISGRIKFVCQELSATFLNTILSEIDFASTNIF